MKNILITGATSGIGFETARILAEQGHNLIITGRDEAKGEYAVEQILKTSMRDNIKFVRADSSLLADMEELAKITIRHFGCLDVLINNAGFLSEDKQMTEEGYETNIAVNFMAPYLLSKLLIPVLEKSPQARVVNLLSSSHRMVKTRSLYDIESKENYLGMDAYGKTKLYNLMGIYYLSEKYPHIGFFAADPGANNTEMMRKAMEDKKAWPAYMRLFLPLFRMLFSLVQSNKPLEEGARSTIYAAHSQDLNDKNGAYILPSTKVGKPSKHVHNKDLRKKVIDWVENELNKRQLQKIDPVKLYMEDQIL